MVSTPSALGEIPARHGSGSGCAGPGPTTTAPGPSPFETSAWDEGGSTLGGHPDWIQDAEHVDCPACRQPMDYLGLVGGADVDFGEGAYYLHLHAPCGVAAVNYQQS